MGTRSPNGVVAEELSGPDEFKNSNGRAKGRTTHQQTDCLKGRMRVADYDAKKTMCSGSLEGVAPNTQGEISNEVRHIFPF